MKIAGFWKSSPQLNHLFRDVVYWWLGAKAVQIGTFFSIFRVHKCFQGDILVVYYSLVTTRVLKKESPQECPF